MREFPGTVDVLQRQLFCDKVVDVPTDVELHHTCCTENGRSTAGAKIPVPMQRQASTIQTVQQAHVPLMTLWRPSSQKVQNSVEVAADAEICWGRIISARTRQTIRDG